MAFPDQATSVNEAYERGPWPYGSYRVVPNITYLTANNWEAKFDVYQARDATTPNPTLVYFHGGGWVAGSKEGSSLTFLPFLSMGWNVVNVSVGSRRSLWLLRRFRMRPALCGGSTGTDLVERGVLLLAECHRVLGRYCHRRAYQLALAGGRPVSVGLRHWRSGCLAIGRDSVPVPAGEDALGFSSSYPRCAVGSVLMGNRTRLSDILGT